MKEYAAAAKEDAKDMVSYFIDEIVESYIDNDKASNDLFNDYGQGDSYHHETHTDKSYNLLEAATLLDELSKYEETDSGLWQGCDAKETISSMAAYTYANAVLSFWNELIDEINEDEDLADIKSRYERLDELESLDNLELKEREKELTGRMMQVISDF